MRTARRSIRRLSLLLTLATALTGCATAGDTGLRADRPALLPGTATLIRSELIFGRARPDGSGVSDEQWKAFVDEQVTPRFPEGLTIIDASGQYRARSGQLVKEPSKIVILLHEADEKSRASIQEIRALYKTLFDQESVLLISALARVSF